MAGKKGMKHYPLEFRQEVVDKRMKDGKSLTWVCEWYGLNRSIVKDWCRWQREYGIPKQMTDKVRGRPRVNGSYETLEQKVKRLEMENALLKKFNELLMEEETKQK